MTPIYFKSLSNDHQYNEHQYEHEFLSPNSQASLSSNSLTCHIFFNPITTNDQADEAFDRDDQSHPSQIEEDNVGAQSYDDQVKWASSKMRLLLKMKKTDQTKLNTLRSATKEIKLQDHHDHKERTSFPMEESANSINSNSSNNMTPVRVCSDCNTTKSPLWRSGPQGPKSLCNACGIRQRKARNAMAAAGAETAKTGNNVFNETPTFLKATKILHKDYKKPNKAHVTKYNNKLCLKQINTKASPARKNTVEEFLVSLSKNLALHCVFPQDEKEAAILLMALSCGYVHQ